MSKIRFSPCACCEEQQLCKLCDPYPDATQTQPEYHVTFWPSNEDGNETTITVQGPNFIEQTPGPGPEFGCCVWNYVGTAGDIPGMRHPTQGGCSDGDAMTVSLELCRRYVENIPPLIVWDWRVTVRIQCDPPLGFRSTGTAVWSKTIEPTPPNLLSAVCDLNTLEPDKFHTLDLLTTCAFNDCDFLKPYPHDPPCINCDHCNPALPPGGCFFPQPQTVKVENAQ